jgi:pSer/pThr/pTyr-binding forkhead associated (FHA) protein
MPTCPIGHDSADDEFCDVCGRAMDGQAPAATPASAPAAAPPAPEPELPAEGATCQVCGAALTGRFCETCGHDSLKPASPRVATRESPAPDPRVPASDVPPVRMPAATAWTAVVSADRAYYETVMAAEGPDAAGITFPPYCPDRHFPLQGKQISIGRQSRSRGIDPDIDLTGPPEDPGVSHLHALLVGQEDGSWAIVDLDSANGLSVNDEARPLRPNVPRVLADGDHVYLGAWTRITLRAT